jgi:hypothetical protein
MWFRLCHIAKAQAIGTLGPKEPSNWITNGIQHNFFYFYFLLWDRNIVVLFVPYTMFFVKNFIFRQTSSNFDKLFFVTFRILFVKNLERLDFHLNTLDFVELQWTRSKELFFLWMFPIQPFSNIIIPSIVNENIIRTKNIEFLISQIDILKVRQKNTRADCSMLLINKINVSLLIQSQHAAPLNVR